MNDEERYQLTRAIVRVLKAEGRNIITPHWERWVENTDAALELVSSPGLLLTLGYDADIRAWHAHLKLVDNTGALISSGGAFDNIVSVAICRAWLAWKENQSLQK